MTMKVQLAVIHHRYGARYFCAMYLDELNDQIADYLDWDNDPDVPNPPPRPKDQDELIKAYFDDDAREEYLEMLEIECVEPGVTTLVIGGRKAVTCGECVGVKA
jgi:hypothetical protein